MSHYFTEGLTQPRQKGRGGHHISILLFVCLKTTKKDQKLKKTPNIIMDPSRACTYPSPGCYKGVLATRWLVTLQQLPTLQHHNILMGRHLPLKFPLILNALLYPAFPPITSLWKPWSGELMHWENYSAQSETRRNILRKPSPTLHIYHTKVSASVLGFQMLTCVPSLFVLPHINESSIH